MCVFSRFFSQLRACLRAEHGSAALIAAVGLGIMVAATGAAIDISRAQMVQARLSNSLDAAGLAAGASINTENASSMVSQYFAANYPTNYMGSTVTGPSVTVSDNNHILSLSASAVMPTTFLQAVGIKTITLKATSQITLQSEGMELVLVLDNTGSMNAAVNSGNSSTSKISALKTAAGELLDVLYGGNNTVPNLWVGVVPFSQAVNIGTGHSSWMNTAYASALDFGPVINGTSCPSWSGPPVTSGMYYSSNGSSGPGCTYAVSSTTSSSPPTTNFSSGNWQGCVMARSSPYDITDDTPSTSLFQAYYFAPFPNPSNATNFDPWRPLPTTASKQTCTGSGRTRTCTTTYTTTTTYNYYYNSSYVGTYGPNMLCPQQVQPMVAEKSTILSAVNSMTAGGDTDLDLGMVWGWRMLSPKWQGLWGGEMSANGLPLAYHTPLMNKVIIFMTDGMNRFVPGDYSGYGFLADDQLGSTNELTAEETLDTRFLSVCTSLKNNGVIIYTIGFGQGNYDNPATESDRGNDLLVDVPILQSCATDSSHFFLAPTNAQLETAFQQIGDSLANLYISQ